VCRNSIPVTSVVHLREGLRVEHTERGEDVWRTSLRSSGGVLLAGIFRGRTTGTAGDGGSGSGDGDAHLLLSFSNLPSLAHLVAQYACTSAYQVIDCYSKGGKLDLAALCRCPSPRLTPPLNPPPRSAASIAMSGTHSQKRISACSRIGLDFLTSARHIHQ
jgi:hypothetical protein